MRKLLLALSFAVPGFAPAWASHEGSGLAVPPGPGFRGGVVAVSHPLAAEAGARMLRSGGNAIDAAAAIQFALNVVEPEFSGIGGGGFMMVHLAKGQGSTFAIEGRERAPASADTRLFTNPDGSNQGFTPASTSGQAVGVPGTLKVVATAVQRATANGGKPGLMTMQDLADYHIVIREPIVGEYRGYRIAAMSPPSSGGLTMIQALKMIERYPLGDAAAGFGFGSAKTLHVMTEAMRLAFADRAAWMGDEDFVPVPKRGLLDPTYVRERGDLISLTSIISGTAPRGDPWPFETAQRPGRTMLAAAEPVSYAGGHTTHFSVVDQWGNIVSYTTTIEQGWGTGIMVPGYGFMLNNELTDFNFGFNMHPRFGGPGPNDVQGGKRPPSSMTPPILLKGRAPVAAFGSPGGATIISSGYNVLINLVDHHMTIQQAVEAPRISVTTADNAIAREAGFDEAEIAKLRALGHNVGSPGTIGNVNAIFIDLETGRQYGAVDSTREGGLIGLPKGHRGKEDD